MDWERFERVVELFDRFEVKPLLGVIPDNRDLELLRYPLQEDFWERIHERVEEGWEVALHGYQHLLDSPSGGVLRLHKHGEFAGHPYELQLARMRRGLEILQEQKINTEIFMAPAHSYDENTLRAMCELGLNVITDGYGLFPKWENEVLHVPQLVAMPRPFLIGVHTFCLHSNLLTEEQFARIELFLERHHLEVISFSEVRQHARKNDYSKPFLGAALPLLRSLS